jgi:3'-phosphoadenosine 5'-phosphosulfate sulfotransferase (PAPS reductase)/FAD synthetase
MAKFNVHDYDEYLVCFSGGKDSIACVLHLLDLGIPKEKIWLVHHLVDGREGSTLMDWPCTDSYCEKFAEAFDMPIRFSWRSGGFEGEMNRNESPTGAVLFEDWDDRTKVITLNSNEKKIGTRQKFPQVSADLSVRWCSAYLKIDVFSRVINNSPRFNGKRTLVITGERAEESAARAKYKVVEPHRCDGRKRTVHQWRPIKEWPVEDVWAIMKRYNVDPHPAYHLGWNRLSCRTCIFISDSAWSTLREIDNTGFESIAEYEEKFGITIHRKLSVRERADKGKVYEYKRTWRHIALSKKYLLPIIKKDWELPLGASSKEVTGPT